MATKRKPVEQGTGINPDDLQGIMDDSVVPEIVGHKPELLGRKLRPVTLASIALLKQIKSDLIAGVNIETSENIIIDSCVFVLLHSMPLEEAAELAFGPPAKLKLAALHLADEIKATNISELTTTIVEMLRDATSTQVKALPKKGELPDNPLGNL